PGLPFDPCFCPIRVQKQQLTSTDLPVQFAILLNIRHQQLESFCPNIFPWPVDLIPDSGVSGGQGKKESG
ncbi:MAG: hypothetical protein QF888_06240, partial [Desulfobacterales bacterium]|nr:hypothetical protein [Desulfobacterales bacterium]